MIARLRARLGASGFCEDRHKMGTDPRHDRDRTDQVIAMDPVTKMFCVQRYEEEIRAGVNTFKKRPGPFTANHGEKWRGRRQLPIWRDMDKIMAVWSTSQTAVVVSGTGSGKTTQLTGIIGYMVDKTSGSGTIVTQPRRLATTECAKRVAEEMDVVLGEEVGYAIRNDVKRRPDTKITFTTEGSLLSRLERMRDLKDCACVIIDEAHERSQETDLLIALLKDLCLQRPEFKVSICPRPQAGLRGTASVTNANGLLTLPS
jgi:HrpA-like RNA helicase